MCSGTNGLKKITPEIVKYSTRTYRDLLNEFINNEKLKAILSDRCPFIGLPPSQVSVLSMAALMMSYFKFGAYRVKGGFQKLADLLTEGIKKKGGTVITGQKVDRILMDNGMCQGINCTSGENYRCRYLISSIDFFSTWNTLMGDKYSLYAKERLKKPGVSPSFFLVYAGIKDDVTLHSSFGYFTSYDMESFFKPDRTLKNDFTLGITVASQEDSTRAPQGYQTVVLHDMFYYLEKKFNRTAYFNKIITRAEKIIPSFKDRTIVVETATPSTLEKYTGNYRGAAFGWKQVPGFTNFKNQGIKNLSQAGHWGTMGGGVLAAAYSGAQAAQEILLKEGIKYSV
jgi:phytoene dehydrogenase-like protein